MHDMLTCPICNAKLRNVNMGERYLFGLDKTANYIERTCTKGMNHSLQIIVDDATKQVDSLKFSLDHKYSKYLYIDFVNQNCRILCYKEGLAKVIEIDKTLEPDFPDLIKLKEKIQLYVALS